MALTVSIVKQSVIGAQRTVTANITFDSAYATGGVALTASNLGLRSTVDMLVVSPTKGFNFEYDYANSKLKAFFTTGGAGTPGSALATATGLAASGASTASAVDATRPTVAILPGVGTEVPASQDLSTLTGVRVWAVGV